MSTSSKPAMGKPEAEVAAFPYPEAGREGVAAAGWPSLREQQERELAAREAGRREGEAQARGAYETRIEEVRKQMAAALDEFARERREYFLAAEREIVQLALSIVRKILRRESNLDPLLLAGMVRVALEHTAQAARVSVRVNPHQVSDFRLFFARNMQENPPEVVEDPALEPERCILHTELGSAEIGPEVQLKEIEQALLDLQAARPRCP